MSFESFATGLGNLLTGNLAQTIFDGIKTYFPPDMTPEQQARLRLELERIEQDKRQQTDNALLEAEQMLTERISKLEGTASDLKSLPVVGRLMLFARGCQRPLWGFFTMYLDWCWFSQWTLSEKQQAALIVVNILVLGFLFGERAIRNLTPLISQLFRKS
ncbi:MAG: hypothetical protein AB2815_10155 [Candidatus Sedimenticola endophacoides]